VAAARPTPEIQPTERAASVERQESHTGAVFGGTIREAGDSAGIPGAVIEIVGVGTRHYADIHGRFGFIGVPPGSHEVRVRVIGYRPWTTRVDFEEGGLYDRTIELQRLAFDLAEVRIEGRTVKIPARYQEVYKRATRGGFGTLITREEIEQVNPSQTKSLFQRIPGVLVDDRGITFERCQAGLGGLMPSQIPNRNTGQSNTGGFPEAAKVQVYIDGVRMTHPHSVQIDGLKGNMKGPPDEMDAEHILRLVPPTAIQAIEVYSGVARIPVEFLDDACAVIAIWTKAY